MKNIKRITLAVLLITFVFPAISGGETSGLEINANSSDTEIKLNTKFQLGETPMGLGVRALNSDENYYISNVSIMLKDAVFIPALTLGLGFQGVFGEAEINNKDYDITALDFVLTADYDFRVDSSNLPICISASICWAPASLGFEDTKRYMEFTCSAYVYIVSNAAIVAGYREIEARFDDTGEKTKSDDAVFVGCKLEF